MTLAELGPASRCLFLLNAAMAACMDESLALIPSAGHDLETFFSLIPAAAGPSAAPTEAVGEVPAPASDIGAAFLAIPGRQRRPQRPGEPPAPPGAGRWQRSRGFMKTLLKLRRVKMKLKAADNIGRMAGHLGCAWDNVKGLRAGDRFTLHRRVRRGASSRHIAGLAADGAAIEAKAHPNTWDLEAALTKAFSEVGGRIARQSRERSGEIGEMHGGRGLFNLSMRVGIFIKAQEAALEKVSQAVALVFCVSFRRHHRFPISPGGPHHVPVKPARMQCAM